MVAVFKSFTYLNTSTPHECHSSLSRSCDVGVALSAKMHTIYFVYLQVKNDFIQEQHVAPQAPPMYDTRAAMADRTDLAFSERLTSRPHRLFQQVSQAGAQKEADPAAAASDQPADGESTKAPPKGAGAGAAASASTLFGAFGKRHYDGGFEEKMTRKEAALILGVRERAPAQRIKVRIISLSPAYAVDGFSP